MFLGFLVVFATMFSLDAHAGFRAFSGDTDLKVAQGLKCSGGMECTMSAKDAVLKMSSGVTPVVAAVAGTLTKAQCGSTFVSSGAVTVNLPLASSVIGCRYTFVVGNASNFVINPDDADQILLLTNALGDSITGAAVGNSVTIQAFAANKWTAIGSEKGTWTDTN